MILGLTFSACTRSYPGKALHDESLPDRPWQCGLCPELQTAKGTLSAGPTLERLVRRRNAPCALVPAWGRP
jgi:hypothetical protein